IGSRFPPGLEAIAGEWPLVLLVQVEEVQGTVAVPRGTSEHRPVGPFPYLVRVNAWRLGAGGVVLIRRLHVDRRLRGRERVVRLDEPVRLRRPAMARLNRVEIQPLSLMKPLRRGCAPRTVIANQLRP